MYLQKVLIINIITPYLPELLLFYHKLDVFMLKIKVPVELSVFDPIRQNHLNPRLSLQINLHI